MRNNKITLYLSFLLLFLFITSSSTAQKWKPFEFKGNETFEFKIKTYDRKGEKTSFYSLSLKENGTKNKKGEEEIEVTYTTKGLIPKSNLGQQSAFGLYSFYGTSLSMAVLNPAYTMFFMNLEFKVGEKMSLMGAGVIEVTGKETIAGRSGFVCKYYQTKGDKKELNMEWVIDPGLAFPLRSVIYNKNKKQSFVEMIKYSTK